MQYPPIQTIQTQLKNATTPEEKDFLEGMLIEMRYDAKELNQFCLDVMNEGNKR